MKLSKQKIEQLIDIARYSYEEGFWCCFDLYVDEEQYSEEDVKPIVKKAISEAGKSFKERLEKLK